MPNSEPAGPRPARRWRSRLLTGALALYFLLGIAFLVLRYAVLPDIERWRAPIARQAEIALGVPVSIAAIEADWSGLRPRLHLKNVVLRDAEGESALVLPQIDATLAWTSILKLRPYFHRLEVQTPELHIARDAQGGFSVAGLPVAAAAGGDGEALRWLMAQRQIVVRGATVIWRDALRQAPPLRLNEVNFRLVKGFGTHALGLTMQPEGPLAESIDMRADLRQFDEQAPTAWTGRLYAAVRRASLESLHAWVDMPAGLTGFGDTRVWLSLQAGQPVAATADLALRDARARLGEDLPELVLDQVAGRLGAQKSATETVLTSRGLSLDAGDGIAIAPTDLRISRKGDGAGQVTRVEVNQLDLAALSALGAHLPFDEAVRSRLAALAPTGRFSQVQLQWTGEAAAPSAWQVSADFDGVGMRARDNLPGLGGIRGHLAGNQGSGRYTLDSESMTLDLPAVFEAPLGFDTLFAEGGWQRRDGALRVTLDRARFANADAQGEASGYYAPSVDGPGVIDLQARLSEADGTAVWRYMPKVVNQDTRVWLRDSITAGRAHDVRLRLQGDLADFPFREGGGIFLITGRISRAKLDYAKAWPAIEAIEGGLRFEGARMEITANQGRIYGVRLGKVRVVLPDLDVPDEVLTITGVATGGTQDFLRFVGDSPVRARIDGFTDDMRAEGDGMLDLKLVMPLRHVADTEVTGRYRFKDNALTLVPGLAPIADAAGQVNFTANALSIPQASGTLFGKPLQLTATTLADRGVRFEARGEAQMAALQAAYAWPALAHLSGETPWSAQVVVRGREAEVVVEAPLSGVSSSLPAPFNKSATEAWPLRAAFKVQPGAPVSLEAKLADRASLQLTIPRDEGAPLRGGLGIGAPVPAGERGVRIAIAQPHVDVDAWRAVSSMSSEAGGALPIERVVLDTPRLTVAGTDLHAVRAEARQDKDRWRVKLRAKEAAGEIDWQQGGEGAVHARFSHLLLKKGEAEAEGAADLEPLESLPALDVVIERFGLRDLELGRLEVTAFNRGGLWHLNQLKLASADGVLTGSGQWWPQAPARTELDFSLDSTDTGALLKRLGHAEAVQGGSAKLAGKVAWQGAPTDLNVATMKGMLTLNAENGQFRKLEPGVGRLLGVLSLQSLPRRITLDFRDVFSEGFAFDSISGSIDVDQGVLRTDSLEIRGPSAKVFMRGSANVKNETQDLNVNVQPTLSESVAVGAALGAVNPVAGVVTYLVQKALKDPVEKAFAFEYHVTGTWSDPVVTRIEAAPPEGGAGSK
ncbi:YhdP family protein [Denitromonas iodatirespirans]|uniref:TIGR02099 family protein n=1 Tax=Denitromonas iodatirespirans TaxID=2795389 RepID=A0A944DBS5_DENI1|nr:YhdP family protein [Denitromonas iodatirespirans]MBT0962517.1 TIGR02099 family protein [Denitromonas iodatirespirans]